MSARVRVLIAVALLAVVANSALASITQNVFPNDERYWTGRVRSTLRGYDKFDDEMFFSLHPPDTAWHGWVRLNLAELPDGCFVESASLWYYVTSITRPEPASVVRVLSNDPLTASPSELWSGMNSGAVVAERQVSDTGWVERPLNTEGLIAVEQGTGNDWVAFGIQRTETGERSRAVAAGHSTPDSRPFLRVTYSPPTGMFESRPVRSGAPELSVEPMPAGNAMAVTYRLPADQPGRLSLLDAAGRVRTQMQVSAGSAGRLTLGAVDLRDGVYLVSLATPQSARTAKVVVGR